MIAPSTYHVALEHSKRPWGRAPVRLNFGGFALEAEDEARRETEVVLRAALESDAHVIGLQPPGESLDDPRVQPSTKGRVSR